jgi:hypothetical protein
MLRSKLRKQLVVLLQSKMRHQALTPVRTLAVELECAWHVSVHVTVRSISGW